MVDGTSYNYAAWYSVAFILESWRRHQSFVRAPNIFSGWWGGGGRHLSDPQQQQIFFFLNPVFFVCFLTQVCMSDRGNLQSAFCNSKLYNGMVIFFTYSFLKTSLRLTRSGNCKKTISGLPCEIGLRTRQYHVLSGSVLSVWSRVEAVLASISSSNMSKMQIIRLRTDDGQRIVGK